MKPIARKRVQGLSLIELMIAILIGLFLLIGVIQVFAAARTAYQLSSGLARAQENGRFAVDYLQRDIRLTGHFGCINDQARLQTAGNLNSHLSTATDDRLNFAVSLQGYEANDTAPEDSMTIGAPTAGWSPALPTYLSSLSPAPQAGSDIVVLRFLASEGVPVTTVAAGELTVDPTKWAVLTNDGVANPTLFGVGDCTYADVFQGASVNPGTGAITVSASGLNATTADFVSRYTASPAGQTTLYRAESMVYYVGTRDGAAGPSLYRVRFGSAAGGGGALVTSQPEEIVEGIENMQVVYGQDQGTVTTLTGNVTTFNTAEVLGTTETEWRRVGQVQVGLLARSPDPAAAAEVDPANATNRRILGTLYTPPADARFRTTYESSIALRNRLYGN